jgi:hypothetical protein
MAYNTKINLSNNKVCQNSGDLLTLSGDTVIAAVGDIRYASEVSITGDTQLTTKKYVDDLITSGVSSGTTYNLSSPATTDVGGVIAGTVLTDKTSNEILAEMLTPYQTPTFSSFSSEMTTTVEVGTVISGIKSFNWGFGNSDNVAASTMCIIDVTDSSTPLATNISISSPQSITIATKTFISCGETQNWKGCAEDSCAAAFGSINHTVTSLLPYFWGVCTCPGTAGDNRPSLTGGDIIGGAKVLAGSAGSFGINFNSSDNDYLWFAVPASVSDKVCWHVDEINNGIIGGNVGAACNLFPAAATVNPVANECWSGEIYEVYVSNKQTSQTLTMTIS